jgi:hypothetical protein
MTFAFLAWRLRDSEKIDSTGAGSQELEFRSQEPGARRYPRLLTLTLLPRRPTKREVVVPVKRDVLGVTQRFFFRPKHAKQDPVQPEFKFLFPVDGQRLYLDIHRILSYSIFRKRRAALRHQGLDGPEDRRSGWTAIALWLALGVRSTVRKANVFLFDCAVLGLGSVRSSTRL